MRCYVRSAWGGGAEDTLGCTPGFYEVPFGWSGAANVITIAHINDFNQWDIWTLSPDGRQPPRPLLQSPFNEGGGRISPDGRWLAYASDESGRFEVYVVPYPGPGPKVQVTTAGGERPAVAAGREGALLRDEPGHLVGGRAGRGDLRGGRAEGPVRDRVHGEAATAATAGR